MADPPFRERRIPPEEVQRIVKRAAELATLEASVETAGLALTAFELEERLQHLGVPADVTRRAMEPPVIASMPAPEGTFQVDRELVVDGVVPPERFEAIAEAIAACMKSPGRVSAVGNKLTWTPAGLAIEPEVSVQVKDGQTRVRYLERLASRGQVTIGFGTLSAFAGMTAGTFGSFAGVVLAKVMHVTAAEGAPVVLGASIALGVVAAVGAFFGLKRHLVHRVEARSVFAENVLQNVAAVVRASIPEPPARARVELGEDASTRDAEASGEEAEALAREAEEAELSAEDARARSKRT